jgi:hypothetical protein
VTVVAGTPNTATPAIDPAVACAGVGTGMRRTSRRVARIRRAASTRTSQATSAHSSPAAAATPTSTVCGVSGSASHARAWPAVGHCNEWPASHSSAAAGGPATTATPSISTAQPRMTRMVSTAQPRPPPPFRGDAPARPVSGTPDAFRWVRGDAAGSLGTVGRGAFPPVGRRAGQPAWPDAGTGLRTSSQSRRAHQSPTATA